MSSDSACTVKVGVTASKFCATFFSSGTKTLQKNIHPIFIDVRSNQDFSSGHIFGAVNVDLFTDSGGSITESAVVSILEDSQYDHLFSGMKYSHVVLYDNFSGGDHLTVNKSVKPGSLRTSKKYPFIKYRDEPVSHPPLQSLLNIFYESFIGSVTEFCLAFNVLEGGYMTLSTYHPQLVSKSINPQSGIYGSNHNLWFERHSGKVVISTLGRVRQLIETTKTFGPCILICTVPHKKLRALGINNSGPYLTARFTAMGGRPRKAVGVTLYGLPETSEDVLEILQSLRSYQTNHTKLFICPYTIPDKSSILPDISLINPYSQTPPSVYLDLLLTHDLEVFHDGTMAYPENISLCLFYSLILELGPPEHNSNKFVRNLLDSTPSIEPVLIRDPSLWMLLLAHETRNSTISGAEFSSLSCSEIWSICHYSESISELLEHSHRLNVNLFSTGAPELSLFSRIKQLWYG